VGRRIAIVVASVALVAVALPARPAAAAAGCMDANYFGQSAYVTAVPGQILQFTVAFMNTGSCGWVRGASTQVNLAVCCPLNSVSSLYAWSYQWYSATAYATTTTDYVGPGQIGWFTYAVRPPIGAAAGTYRFYGELVIATTGAALNPQGYYQEVTILGTEGIRGRVTNLAGAPLTLATADAFLVGCLGCGPVASTTTNALGEYDLAAPSGSYYVRASRAGYVARFYVDKATIGSADLIAVPPGMIRTGIDIKLPEASIRGRVTDETNPALGLPNVSVWAWDANGTFVAGTVTDSAGNFDLGLAAGTYRVQFMPQPGSGYYQEWWDQNALTRTAAADVVVAAGSTQILNVGLSRAFTISGTLTNASGATMSGVVVHLFDVSPASTMRCAPACGEFTQAASGTGGTYSVTVPNGSFTFILIPPSGSTSAPEWYKNASAVTPTTVTVAGANVTASMAFRPAITGLVRKSTLTGAVVPFVWADAYDTSCSFVATATMMSDAQGWYAIPVAAGQYRVLFRPPVGANGWYVDKTTCAAGDTVNVTATAGAPNSDGVVP